MEGTEELVRRFTKQIGQFSEVPKEVLESLTEWKLFGELSHYQPNGRVWTSDDRLGGGGLTIFQPTLKEEQKVASFRRYF